MCPNLRQPPLNNQHVRLLFSEPGAIAIAKFTQVEGADIVLKSTLLTD
jgi:hypothetical protein